MLLQKLTSKAKSSSWYGLNESDEDENEEIYRQLVNYGAILEFKLIGGIPTFSGNFNIEDFLDWEYEVDCFIEFLDVLGNVQVEMVAYKLKGAT